MQDLHFRWALLFLGGKWSAPKGAPLAQRFFLTHRIRPSLGCALWTCLGFVSLPVSFSITGRTICRPPKRSVWSLAPMAVLWLKSRIRDRAAGIAVSYLLPSILLAGHLCASSQAAVRLVIQLGPDRIWPPTFLHQKPPTH